MTKAKNKKMEKADLDQIMSSGWPSTFDLALRKIAFG